MAQPDTSTRFFAVGVSGVIQLGAMVRPSWFASFLERFKRDAEIINSNYGRDDGWIVERDGTPIAILTDPKWEDMFWVSYKVEALAPDAIELLCKFEKKLVFRSRRFLEIAPGAFPGIGHAESGLRDGRLAMRALYLLPHSDSILTQLYAWKLQRRSKGRRQ